MNRPTNNLNLNEVLRQDKVNEEKARQETKQLSKQRQTIQKEIDDGNLILGEKGHFETKKDKSEQTRKYLRNLNIKLESDDLANLIYANHRIDEVLKDISDENKLADDKKIVNHVLSSSQSIKGD